MGIDIHVRVTKYNKEKNIYEEIALFRKVNRPERSFDKNYPFETVSIYDGRDYEMFDGMKDGDDIDGYGYFPWTDIKLNSYEENFRNEIKEKMENKDKYGYFDFYEISLPLMKLYTNEHPKVVDYNYEYDDEKDKVMKVNPIVNLYDKILSYIDFADEDFFLATLDDYKVVFYFDC